MLSAPGRVALFLLASILILAGADVAYQAANTLQRLDVIEAERDGWQHSEAIVGELGLSRGSVVADLGCGSGYFTLKLSPLAGPSGRVLAVDLRKLSLAFLWMRTVLRHQHNVSIVHAEPDDPRLPSNLDAVLLVNTYHELTNAKIIVDRVFRSLKPGGRLVIADRAPRTDNPHAIASSAVADALATEGFEIVRRQENFLEQPAEGPWWLIVARKP